ncbi:hypothetical protein D3C87_329140 [compost metagenome]
MKYLLFFSLLCLTLACKKQDVATYSGEDGITFYRGQYETDSLSYSFAFSITPKQKDTIFLKMRVQGPAVGYARTVAVKAVGGTTAREGIDYQLSEAKLPAGALILVYPVVLLNSPGMLTNTYRLVVEVAPNKDFATGAFGSDITGETVALKSIKIDVSNRIVQPTYWTSIQGSFGTFSVAKFKFMIQVTGLTDFSEEAIGIDGYYNLPIKLSNALVVYETANGPLIDENGNRVTF